MDSILGLSASRTVAQTEGWVRITEGMGLRKNGDLNDLIRQMKRGVQLVWRFSLSLRYDRHIPVSSKGKWVLRIADAYHKASITVRPDYSCSDMQVSNTMPVNSSALGVTGSSLINTV